MRRLLALVLAGTALFLAGCSSAPNQNGNGTVRVRMTDAPGQYDAVNLVVTGVAVHRAFGDSLDGWEALALDSTRVIDLLTLRNGVFLTLAQGVVPAGHYTQIRLKLGAGSSVVVAGVTYPLTVPSGLQTGYKLVGEFDVPANGLVDLALDFDAERSVHQTGEGRYMLRPTVRMMPFSTAGAIAGTLVPDSTAADVYAILGADTLARTTPDLGGHFMITPLGVGSYTVAIHPAAGFRDTALAGVAVTAQQTTQLGEVVLTPQ